MADLFRTTVFGTFLRLISGGKVFGWEEQQDPALLEKYLSATKKPVPENAEDSDQEEKEEKQPIGDDAEAEKGGDVQLVDFIENDAQNPRNWSTAKKVFVTFQICLLTTSVYIGSAIYTPGVQMIAEEFNVSETASVLGLTLFVIGYALGPMIWAPMSEVPYIGRTPVYIFTLAAFVVLQLAVIYAKNFGMLLAFRFITGFVGSPVLATGGATIADMYKPSKQVYGIAVWGIAAVLGPAMGPLVGGFAAESKGWRWTIWELMWLSGFCLVFLFFLLPETSSSNILYRRAGRLRKHTGNKNLKCQPEIEADGMSGNEILMMTLVRPFTISFTEPICFFLNMYIALVYALIYCWFESFPIVFVGIYKFSLGTEGLAFAGILMGAFIIMVPFFYYVYRYIEPKFDPKTGILSPIELRLTPAFVGAFFIPVCLFWFGWSARPSIHWIMPIIGSSYFSMGAFLLFMSVLTYLGDAYPKYVASVYAGNDLMRSSFGAAFPLFATAMYNKLGVGWASSLLGFLSIAFIPIPFVLYFYGARIRSWSKMARHD